MRPEFDQFWSKLFSFIETKAAFEADVMINFLRNLDDHSKILLITGGLRLPFQHSISVSIARFIMGSVHELVRIRERLIACGIITPNRFSFLFHAVARWSMNDAFFFASCADLGIDIFTSMFYLTIRQTNCNTVDSTEKK